MSSEIFNEYAKIALKTGLIKNAQEETNPRYDSHDLSDIEMLYGVKPDDENKDILDQAHPDPVVIAPAYDKLNGLVENLKERQNVMVDIALKPSDGKLTQERYIKANYALVQELTKLGFMLDRKGEEELMRLADSCNNRIAKRNIIKKALHPLLLPLLGVGAALFGFYALNNSEVIGVKQNAQKALEDISELIEDNNIPGIEEEIEPMKKALEKLVEASEMAESIKISNVDIGDAKDENETKSLIDKAHQAKKDLRQLYNQNAFKILAYYVKVSKLVQKMIPKYMDLIKLREQQHQGTEWYSWFGRKLRYLYQSPAEDVVDELEALYEAITENLKLVAQHKKLLAAFSKEKESMEKLDKVFEEIEKEKEKLLSIPNKETSSKIIDEEDVGSVESELAKLKLE